MEHELAVAEALARRAGRIVMDVYATEFAVFWKGPNDPVTEADRRANDVIVRGLREAFPDDLVVAEESPHPAGPDPDAPPPVIPAPRVHGGRVAGIQLSAAPPAADASAPSRVWYVDPVDGTKEFIARNGEFSVMIGLAVDGRARVGVVYRPDDDVLYAGVVGAGAWMEHHGKRAPLSTGAAASEKPLTFTVSRSHRHPLLKKITRALAVGDVIPLGSVGLKVGVIARGDADVYVEPGAVTKLWDACGPEAVLRAAGGQFTTILGQPVTYGLTPLNNPHGLLATNGACHDRVVRALRPMADALGLTPRDAPA